MKAGAEGIEVMKMHAISRIYFNPIDKKHTGLMGKEGKNYLK